ncbi:type IV secretory system conjugative DNA transfer family protein, partial [Klebsiella oxytoca]
EENPYNNMILTRDVALSMNSRKTMRNNNILVVGGSGSGKTRFMIKPNLLQANCSFVITDPKGEILESEGEMLKKHGYKIKVFNLT